ncbi:glycogen/starch/alpha-glucan phosphorylase [Metabacillus sp. GX 13764]|uniref:glycogen/starch/alpha-glucan phosphorylase n=1 Tax=Metabacillus kandeliae TaxID=2900151 RepID=UPI001E484CEC|nr:glycogen/starch/alpha-glucan phosphorylase [Metabacillus kandeliae]MCD7032602.1 glycogen/starch/alpha-glucan phosphorylase [Metabacillus kandeliae]
MFSSKEEFQRHFLKRLEMMYGKTFRESTRRDQYNTLGLMVREYISSNWIRTNESNRTASNKQVYYFSIEFLLGRMLGQNLINLDIREIVQEGLAELGIQLHEIEEAESDAGLGNGGLGRLAACFLDSLASLNLPGHGCGIRYKHGLFDQKIVDGYQVEYPDQWLRHGNVWEVRKPDQAVEVAFWGYIDVHEEAGRTVFKHVNHEHIMAVPYDMPVIGFRNKTVNTLRLWSAEPSPAISPSADLIKYKRDTEAVSEYLYPDDSHDEGKILRLKQQYFLVSASLQNIVSSHRNNKGNVCDFHEHAAIHVNDTHPVLAIPEMMRILIDQEGMGWDEAWHITTRTFSYTNHTTLSEALEKWPVYLFKPLLPRIYMIIEEINRRFCEALWNEYPGDWGRIEQMAIIAHGVVKMAHLAIAGCHSINGVAKIHSEILKHREMKLFYEFEPEKFNNKTNGITHRRWLLKANPELSALITEANGDGWVKDAEKLSELRRYVHDPSFKEKLSEVKQKRKKILAERIYQQTGLAIDETSIFDVQVKRLHAYKRQLLNVLHIMYLANRLKEDSNFSIYPRTFIFGAKASPSYYYAKKIIKLINSLADKVNNDHKLSKMMKVVFMENYRVSLAEDIFPAADVSEQISTASKEASGTGNMKFMMNGALTIGTLDGANIEILDAVGENNIFTFGLSAGEVLNYYESGGYRAAEYYHHDSRLRQVIDQLMNGYFHETEGEFGPIFDSLLAHNDEYFVLRDFSSYAEAHERVEAAYIEKDSWLEKSIINIANSGVFSSDRTIKEYADDIWRIHPI